MRGGSRTRALMEHGVCSDGAQIGWVAVGSQGNAGAGVRDAYCDIGLELGGRNGKEIVW